MADQPLTPALALARLLRNIADDLSVPGAELRPNIDYLIFAPSRQPDGRSEMQVRCDFTYLIERRRLPR